VAGSGLDGEWGGADGCFSKLVGRVGGSHLSFVGGSHLSFGGPNCVMLAKFCVRLHVCKFCIRPRI
jgi:hypothetical protein